MPEETPSQHISTALWDRVQHFFTGTLADLFRAQPDIVNPLWNALADRLGDAFDGYGVSYLKNSLEQALETLDIPVDVKETIRAVMGREDFGSLLLAYLFIAVYYFTTLSAHSGVAALKATHKWNKEYTPTLPDVNSLIVNLFRNPELKDDITSLLGKHGYSSTNIQLLLDGAKTILNPEQVRNLFLRNIIDDDTHTALLKQFGYSGPLITQLKELYYPIPSYPDLINMAVREAFQEEYIEEYGLLAEYPAAFEAWAKQQGLSSEWCKKYWAAHWSLPSIFQAYEMLHRGVITDENLDSLFMAQDIMPFWRDKLKAISYSPLTRVDVRRVYRMGIIEEADVKRTYLNLGYADQEATWLTKFTTMEALEKDRDLTKAEIISAYVKRIISPENTVQFLTDLGYAENEIGVLLANADYAEYKRVKALTVARIKKMYLAGVYDHTEAVAELGRLDMPGSEQTALINEWESEKLSRLRRLTKKEYAALWQAGIITDIEYQQELGDLGYTSKHIAWSLALLKKGGEEE